MKSPVITFTNVRTMACSVCFNESEQLVNDHCSNDICGNTHPLCSECVTKIYGFVSNNCPFCRQPSQKYPVQNDASLVHVFNFNLSTDDRRPYGYVSPHPSGTFVRTTFAPLSADETAEQLRNFSHAMH